MNLPVWPRALQLVVISLLASCQPDLPPLPQSQRIDALSANEPERLNDSENQSFIHGFVINGIFYQTGAVVKALPGDSLDCYHVVKEVDVNGKTAYTKASTLDWAYSSLAFMTLAADHPEHRLLCYSRSNGCTQVVARYKRTETLATGGGDRKVVIRNYEETIRFYVYQDVRTGPISPPSPTRQALSGARRE